MSPFWILLEILDFIRATGDGGGGKNWSYMTCKAPVITNKPTPSFYRPDALFVAQPYWSTDRKMSHDKRGKNIPVKEQPRLCCVVDLVDRVLLTPFRTMIVPPPMSAYYLQVAAPVAQVAFCQSAKSSNDIAVLLCTGQLVIYMLTACKVLQFYVFTIIRVVFTGGRGGDMSWSLNVEVWH